MQTFYLQQGPPQQGTASALSGVAEKGDELHVTGHGCYVNQGTKVCPNWQPKVYATNTMHVLRWGGR